MPIAIVNHEWILLAIYGTVGFSVYTFARMLLQEQETRAAEENLSELKGRKSSDFFVKILRPICTHYVAPLVRGRKYWEPKREEIRRKLIASGMREELTIDEYIALKYLLFAFLPIVGGIVRSLDLYDVSLPVAFGLSVLGWFYPNILLSGKAKKRQTSIRKTLPFVVDLMALSTEAGLDLVGAMGKVVEKANRSPLIEELDQVLREIRLGSSRANALKEMAARIDMREVGSFVSILVSAEQMGASIGKTLRQQSDGIRSQRFVLAEKAGVAASQKILFPLVFFILPAVMLMVFGPFALEFFRGGR